MMGRGRAALACLALILCRLSTPTVGQSPPGPTREQMREFLLTAEIVGGRQTGEGITLPWRLTLSDGTLTHEASYSTVDERRSMMEFSDGSREVGFVDSYQYNVAAYDLAVILGLGDMMPVTVERRWQDKRGALSWWIDDVVMSERARLQKGIRAPDTEAWNRQIHRMRVFGQLVYDTDRNAGNVLIDKNWKLWMIDFTRAFRPWARIQGPQDLTRCDRRLLERLRALTDAEVHAAVGERVSSQSLKGLLVRRRLIVEHFDKLVAQKGEAAVLY
jgi:hypothetical protein